MSKYDKRFKDILSQIMYTIDEKLLLQWFITGLIHKIRAPLSMHEFLTCEYDLKKSQQVESNDDFHTSSIDQRIEENLEMMQKTIQGLYLRNSNMWCTLCMI